MRVAPPARSTVCAALIVYCASIIFLSWSPMDQIDWSEWVAGGAAILAIIGLIAHALESVQLPGEEYAYLVTGFAGFTTMLLYDINAVDQPGRKIAITLMLLCGVVGSYGAYLSQIDHYEVDHG